MTDNDQSSSPADEIIFSAQYSAPRVLIAIIVVFMPLTLILFGAVRSCLSKSDYWGAAALGSLGAIGVLACLELLFVKEIIFYGDRVTKFWHFGSKTIFYSRGLARRTSRLRGPDFIVEVRKDGNPVRLRWPVMYHRLLFPSDTAKKIETIIDYLAENQGYYDRIFKKPRLPREIILQEP